MRAQSRASKSKYSLYFNDLQNRYYFTPLDTTKSIAPAPCLAWSEPSHLVICRYATPVKDTIYMSFFFPGPLIATLVLFAASTALGMAQVTKMIRIHEAKHELKQGSAGFIRSIAGWSLVAFWVMAVWFCATVIGDWGSSGDLSGAMDRAWLRLRILLEIAAALAEADN